MSTPVPDVGAELAVPAGYREVYAETFDSGTAPSATRWSHDTDLNKRGWYNGERQYYAHADSDAARVADGKLRISAVAHPPGPPRPSDWGGQGYTSARITTAGHARWHYGFFSVRARLPRVRGAWPAIWLLPERHDFRWDGGEIDIAELVGHRPDEVHQGIQTRAANFRRGNQPVAVTRQADDAFHDYQVLWTPDRVVFGIDGRVTFIAPAVGLDRPMALILNVAVGGDWAGAEGIADASFPATMEVDSIRVWQP